MKSSQSQSQINKKKNSLSKNVDILIKAVLFYYFILKYIWQKNALVHDITNDGGMVSFTITMKIWQFDYGRSPLFPSWYNIWNPSLLSTSINFIGLLVWNHFLEPLCFPVLMSSKFINLNLGNTLLSTCQ